MKNTLLALTLALAATFSAQAQDSTEVTVANLKPVAGDRSVEVGSNFIFNNYYNNYTGTTLKFRKFTSDNNALRIGFSANFDNNNPNDDISGTYGTIRVIPGFEHHFAGTNRLSPYIGADLPLSIALSRYEDKDKIVKGAWNENELNSGSYFGVGLNVVGGVDFYIIKNFYVGLELGAGIAYTKYSDIEVEYKESSFDNRTIERGSNISFSTFSNSGIRLGFVF